MQIVLLMLEKNFLIRLKKIISGGQTGADQAGLKAAKAKGYLTGGWLPKGCLTLEGPRFDLIQEYEMKECLVAGYAARTERNIQDSDGTIRFATNWKSAGEKCTLRNLKWHKKSYFDIDIGKITTIPSTDMLEWLALHEIKTLNIAGNSEETSPGIHDLVYHYLCSALPEA